MKAPPRSHGGPPTASVPGTGLAGLLHWRHDLPAGLQVALLWTPFALGVALASGAPAIAGLISAIVAGLLYPLLGGSHVTVSGPAAALAPVVLWGVLSLGHGDPTAGYPLVLVAIVATGALQLLLSALRAGRYAAMLPATVVEAMLAAIGVMIILRQLPLLVGAPNVPRKSVADALVHLPAQLAHAQVAVAAIGIASLALMFALRRRVTGVWRWLPPAITVAAAGVAAGWFFGLEPRFRIAMPENFLAGFHAPDFARVLQQPDLWVTLVLVVVTFTLIDGVESVASVKAVDKIDPWHRKSDPNKTLRAMGVCNLASGMLGGLTIIPNAVPSRANIDAGARTLWSNFYSGVFLLVFAVAGSALLARIPLASIAAILIYIGWRLCEPALFARMLAMGRDRFLVFVGTVVAILLTDLLVGMLIGIAIEMLLLTYLLMPSLRLVLTGRLSARESFTLLAQNFGALFRSPVIRHRVETQDGKKQHVLTLGSLVGFNLLPLERTLAAIPPREGLLLRLTESARIIDHTAAEFLQHAAEEAAARGRPFAVEGLETFHRFSDHPLAARMQEARLAQQKAERDARAQQMAALAARLGLSFDARVAATLNPHDFIYLRRGDHREECNRIEGDWQGARLRIFDYSHTSPPDYHVAHRHTLAVAELPGRSLGHVVITPGHYLERYLVRLEERPGVPELAAGYRLWVGAGTDAAPLLVPAVQQALATHGPLYLELHGDAVLLFRPPRGLEDEAGIESLLAALQVVLSALALTQQRPTAADQRAAATGAA
jgi:MFS superfamily sulfate permease-like transporter